MAIEIERKFLVTGEFATENYSDIIQAYLSIAPELVVRIRIESGCATIAVKGRAHGITHLEFEYQIPEKDGQELLKLTVGEKIKKTRYRCKCGLHIWEVDVFHGENSGLVVAEIELNNEMEQFEFPDWIGKEVSEEKKYGNDKLAINPYSQWNNK